ncbi:MAG: murein biosynthesis integral membrane protein MurJ, partial [Alphaproteobacteria bacterium]|nr:murein biosynthesis integral membrane protein MurJ [Alphaproteobacteria bacterium]
MALLRAIATVGGWTMGSRVLGFIRDMAIAAIMGAGPIADAFFVAFQFPNLFRRLIGEGAFNAAFVPLFAGTLETEGHAAAKRFAEATLAVLLPILIIFTVAVEFAMPAILAVIAPGFRADPAKFAMTVDFARLTFPYLMMMSLVALMSGILNALHRFAAAAAAPILLNVVLIASLLMVHAGVLPHPGYALSWGVALAGIGQFLWLAAACQRAGLLPGLPRPRLTAKVRRLFRLMLPGVIGAGVYQVNVLVGIALASLLPEGAVSYLYYADRVNQLPLGVIGAATGVALLPMLTRQLRGGDGTGARDSQNRAIEFSMLLTLPAAAALVAIAYPVIATLFERGAFTADDARAAAATLAAFALGLPAYVLVKALSPGFFAREDTATPVKVAVCALALNIVLAYMLMQVLAQVGIALAAAVTAWV